MPIVPERPLSRGEKLNHEKRIKSYFLPSRSFAEVDYVRPTKNAPQGYIKRTKLIDKRLIAEDISNIRHIQSIKREEFYTKANPT